MKNIFENAYFGKAYKIRDGRKAIYLGESHHVELAVHNGDDYYSVYKSYNTDGTYDANNMEFLDVVSKWQEINDEELSMLAFNHYCKDCHYCESANAKTIEEKYEACQKSECYRKTYVWKLINGYKAGYREAKEKQI